MNLKNYFEIHFWNDFKSIPTTTPNKTILESPEDFFVHNQILFFGGEEWGNYNEDIALIGSEKRENFVSSLFIISTIDYYIKNNINLYSSVYQLYDPPKLGFCGYGPHFTHPYTILKKWACNQNQNYNFLKRKEEVKELFEFIMLKYHINVDDFKNIIISNTLNIPQKFNHPVFFEFLDFENARNWKKTVSNLLN